MEKSALLMVIFDLSSIPLEKERRKKEFRNNFFPSVWELQIDPYLENYTFTDENIQTH